MVPKPFAWWVSDSLAPGFLTQFFLFLLSESEFACLPDLPDPLHHLAFAFPLSTPSSLFLVEFPILAPKSTHITPWKWRSQGIQVLQHCTLGQGWKMSNVACLAPKSAHTCLAQSRHEQQSKKLKVLECSFISFLHGSCVQLPVCLCSNVITARRPCPDSPSKITPPITLQIFCLASFSLHLTHRILMVHFCLLPLECASFLRKHLCFLHYHVLTLWNGAWYKAGGCSVTISMNKWLKIET